MAAVALGNEELFQSYVVCSEYDSRKYDTKDTLVTQLTYGKIHAGSLQNSKTESNWYILQMIIWIKKLFYNPISFMRILKMTRRETFQSNLYFMHLDQVKLKYRYVDENSLKRKYIINTS